MAEALYRKYRPQVFADVVGQEHIARTVRNAIAQDKVSHAYLFCGPRGTGKTTMARLFAKALLCQQGPTPEPDGACEDCALIAAGTHPDVYELDAASRTGVDNVREEIISRVNFAPTRRRYKIYIIDEVHMLSTAAFNALLKTLEEPPSHVVFILCTTDPQKVLATIQSRCQRFDFRRISPDDIAGRLAHVCEAEGVSAQPEALALVARHAQGGMRDALTSLEQLISFGEGAVTLAGAQRMFGAADAADTAQLVAALAANDLPACFMWVERYAQAGADFARFAQELARRVRDLYVVLAAGAGALAGDEAEGDDRAEGAQRAQLAQQAAAFGPARLTRMLTILGDLALELKSTTDARLAFEVALTRMAHPESERSIEALEQRIEQLEQAVARLQAGRGAADAGAQVATAAMPVATAAMSAASAAPADAVPASASAPADESPAHAESAAKPSAASRAQADQKPVSAGRAAKKQEPAAQVPAKGDVGDGRDAASRTASEPAAAKAAAKPAAFGSIADMQRKWQSALAALKKEKAAYGALFLNTRVVFDDARGMIRIVFGPESSFAFKAAQKPEISQALAAAVAGAFRAEIPFCFDQDGGGVASGESAGWSEPAAATASATEAVKAARAGKPEPRPEPKPENKPASEPKPELAAASAVAKPEPQPKRGSASQAQAARVPETRAAYEEEEYGSFVPDDYLPAEAYEDERAAASSGDQAGSASRRSTDAPNAAEPAIADSSAEPPADTVDLGAFLAGFGDVKLTEIK